MSDLQLTVPFVVYDYQRRAIRARMGKRGLATDAEVRREIGMIIEATFQDYVHEHENRKKR